ncbi:MAG: GFA family protein [Caulobacteraceae bacterium]|nr:GFA family protein [Caulobacteraceae bacterium]
MLAGSCLCGAVAYEVDAEPGPIVHCHCETCRKAHGSAFSSLMGVPRAAFRWTRGEDGLSMFESSPGKLRRFCAACGSQVVAERTGQPNIMLRLGCLDTPITDRPKAHIWRSDAASWYDPKDALPELAEGAPPPKP